MMCIDKLIKFNVLNVKTNNIKSVSEMQGNRNLLLNLNII